MFDKYIYNDLYAGYPTCVWCAIIPEKILSNQDSLLRIQKKEPPEGGNEFEDSGSEGPDFSFDDHVGYFVHVVEPLVCDGLGLGLPCLELLLLLGIGKYDLHGTVERL